jgi:Restriction endonuclease fold toxin 5
LTVSDTGFVGLDPDLARDLARSAGQAGETAGHIAATVAGVLAVAQIEDNGFHALCAEVEEELGLLKAFLEAKATEMELAGAGVYMSISAGAAAALWESLTDGHGEGVDLEGDPDAEETTVTMSSTVAATMLAEYLGWLGGDDRVGRAELWQIATDESVPPEVRAAAQYFVVNEDVLIEGVSAFQFRAGAEDFAAFATGNAHLAVFAQSFARFDTAYENDDDFDGHVSFDDVNTVANDTTGRFTAAEQEAAQWLIDHPEMWADRRALTHELYTRRIFAENPELAVQWLQQAQQDPGAFVHDTTWLESEGGRSWLNTAVASTTDPAAQAEILIGFASIYQATAPEPVGPLTIVHNLLDLVSFVDPFQVADALNAGIYVLEGDNLNAGIAAAGILLPLGGGGAIRIGKEALVGLAARRGDEFAEAVLKQAIKSGEFTDEMLEQTVKEVTDQFGDDAGRAVREYLDDLRRAPDLDTGPGGWTTKNESMSPRAADFQASVTGAPPGTVYRLHGVDFDGFSNGVLLDAKGPGYANLLDRNGEIQPWARVRDEWLDDAERQLRAADGVPVRWVVAEPETAAAIRRLLAREGFDEIEVIG